MKVPSSAITSVLVVVPAHNEQAWIGSCLRSVAIAAGEIEQPVTIRVVLDSCTDHTAAVISEVELPGVRLQIRQVTAGNVGAARAAGVNMADCSPSTWIAHTDADTVVPPQWLRYHLRYAAAGADAVVGTVGIADWSVRPVSLSAAFAAQYQPTHGHRHIHGANLGVRASAYAAVGGFSPLRVHEDVDLVRRLQLCGARLEWAADCQVVTSARVSQRTPGGFSGFLDALGS